MPEFAPGQANVRSYPVEQTAIVTVNMLPRRSLSLAACNPYPAGDVITQMQGGKQQIKWRGKGGLSAAWETLSERPSPALAQLLHHGSDRHDGHADI